MGAALKARQHAEVWGIESNTGAAQRARSRLDRVIEGDIESLYRQTDELPSRYFDTIVYADVLEHWRDPLAVLRGLRRTLAPNGQVIASIPNTRHYTIVAGLLAGNWTYEPAGLLDRTHLRFFTRREMEKLFFRAGFSVENTVAIPGPGFEEWEKQGRPGEVKVKGLHIGGLPAETAEEFFTYQYLFSAKLLSELNYALTSIVLVTYNQVDYTRRCLESIEQFTDLPYEIIVVDNASSDDTRDYLRRHPRVQLLANATNRGFPAAANQGIRAASGQQILLLNNDTIVTTGWLERLLSALEQEHVGLVGPCSNCVSGPQEVTVGYKNLTDLDGWAWDWSRAHRGQTVTLDRLVGFCLLVRREVFEKIGLLDERFGIGCYEDDDICRRAIAAGFRAVVAQDAFVHHFGSRTFICTFRKNLN